MMPGASDQKVLDFKPRNEHRHYSNIWVTDYQKHNSEKLKKHWHVEMHKEKEQLKSWSESTQKCQWRTSIEKKIIPGSTK